jgi:hypothetical protein
MSAGNKNGTAELESRTANEREWTRIIEGRATAVDIRSA